MITSLRIDNQGQRVVFYRGLANEYFEYPSWSSLKRLAWVVNRMIERGEIQVHLDPIYCKFQKRSPLYLWYERKVAVSEDGDD